MTLTAKALLRKRRCYHLRGMIWFSLRDRRPDRGRKDWWVLHTGLFDLGGRPKPAWRAFARVAHGRAGSGPL